MKNNILVLSLLCFFSLQLFGQNTFSSNSLLGPEYKLILVENNPKFSLQIEFGKIFPGQKGIESYNGGGMDTLLQTMYTTPGLFEQLYESLGGEFFIGSFTEAPKFENFTQENGNYLGFSGTYRFGDHFEATFQFSAYQTNVAASFPVVIFDNSSFETTSSEGKISTDLKSNSIQVLGKYFPLTGKIQPFVGAGLAYTSTKSGVTKAQIHEVIFELQNNPSSQSLGGVIDVGVVVILYKNVQLQLSSKMFSVKAPDGKGMVWNKTLSAGLGCRF